MPNTVLWIGHEADCYILASSTQTEQGNAILAGAERTGMRVGRSGGGIILSSPAWTAQADFWHTWRANGSISLNEQLWIGYTAAGLAVLRLLASTTALGQFQIWTGSAWSNIGPTFALTSATAKCDLHVVTAVAGALTFYYGTPGSQSKVVDITGDFSGANGIVQIGHDANTTGGGFDNDIAHEIVQTSATLNVISENKPPTADGTDTDGGVPGFSKVNPVTYNDANYLALTASGKHSSFTGAARTLTQAVPLGVTATCRAWYEGGGPTQMKPYLLIGGTRYYGATFTLDLVAKGYQYTWNLDPSTGLAWTVSAANAATLQWGWEAV